MSQSTIARPASATQPAGAHPSWCDLDLCERDRAGADGAVTTYHRVLLLDSPGRPRPLGDGDVQVELYRCVTVRADGTVESADDRLHFGGLDNGVLASHAAEVAEAVTRAAILMASR
jgi:hypothetical protein